MGERSSLDLRAGTIIAVREVPQACRANKAKRQSGPDD